MYGVQTRVMNQAVKRNIKRFPIDFMFQMTASELEDWKSQIVTSNREKMGIRKLPNVFTEQGVSMLSSVINSEIAIDVNIRIMRIFTKMRAALLNNQEILLKLEQLDKKLVNLGHDVKMHDGEIETVFELIKEIMEEKSKPATPRTPIGFKNK
jgi:ORF6N domain